MGHLSISAHWAGLAGQFWPLLGLIQRPDDRLFAIVAYSVIEAHLSYILQEAAFVLYSQRGRNTGGKPEARDFLRLRLGNGTHMQATDLGSLEASSKSKVGKKNHLLVERAATKQRIHPGRSEALELFYNQSVTHHLYKFCSPLE